VKQRCHPARSPRFIRLLRAEMARWLAVALLIPLMTLGSFGGGQFLAHGHDEHGTHLHPVGSLDDGKLAASAHADHHGHDHSPSPSDLPVDEDRDDDGEVPAGVIVSIDVHKPLPARGIDLGETLLPPAPFVIAVFAMAPEPDLDRHIGSPGGKPLGLIGLSASDRLVRTSRALLI
jgi:hypothetical protein